MTEVSVSEQVEAQLKDAEASLTRLAAVSQQMVQLRASLDARVDVSKAQLDVFENSLSDLRATINAFVDLPNGVQRLAGDITRVLAGLETASDRFDRAAAANLGLVPAVETALRASLADAMTHLEQASADAALGLRALVASTESTFNEVAGRLADSAEVAAQLVTEKVDGSVRAAASLLESSLHELRGSAAKALDPVVDSVRTLLIDVRTATTDLAEQFRAVSGPGLADLHEALGAAFGSLQGLMTSADDRMTAAVNEYRGASLAIIHQQRMAAQQASEAASKLGELLDRSDEFASLSDRLAGDTELLRAITSAAGADKGSVRHRADVALSGGLLAFLVAVTVAELDAGTAAVVVSPMALLAFLSQPILTPIIEMIQRHRTRR